MTPFRYFEIVDRSWFIYLNTAIEISQPEHAILTTKIALLYACTAVEISLTEHSDFYLDPFLQSAKWATTRMNESPLEDKMRVSKVQKKLSLDYYNLHFNKLVSVVPLYLD